MAEQAPAPAELFVVAEVEVAAAACNTAAAAATAAAGGLIAPEELLSVGKPMDTSVACDDDELSICGGCGSIELLLPPPPLLLDGIVRPDCEVSSVLVIGEAELE